MVAKDRRELRLYKLGFLLSQMVLLFVIVSAFDQMKSKMLYLGTMNMLIIIMNVKHVMIIGAFCKMGCVNTLIRGIQSLRNVINQLEEYTCLLDIKTKRY